MSNYNEEEDPPSPQMHTSGENSGSSSNGSSSLTSDVPCDTGSMSNSLDNDSLMQESVGVKRSFANVDDSSFDGVSGRDRSMADSFVMVNDQRTGKQPSDDVSESSYEYISPPNENSGEESSRRKELHKAIVNNQVADGDVCFVVSRSWLDEFHGDIQGPAPLPHAAEGAKVNDPVALPSEAGELITKWFNIDDTSDYISRAVEIDNKQVVPEPYRVVVEVRLRKNGEDQNVYKAELCLSDTVADILKASGYSATSDDVKLWKFEEQEQTQTDLSDNLDRTLLDLEFQDNEVVLVELIPRPVAPRGKVGLQNLCNTCYMNSALQCLAHVEELTCYFLSKEFKEDINTDNPIGHNGNVAKSFGRLITNMFANPDQRSFRPSEFKQTIGRYNSMFSGYQQQDSQELLAFLLDGLHEDLNKIIKKPATEKPELPDDKVHDPEAIAELANSCWEMHKKRNDSVILDLFAGLYQSILVCPDCDKVSITFDPFMDLTLPLPIDSHWTSEITVLPLNDTPKKLKVVLDKHDTIKDLKKYIGDKMGIDPRKLHAADVFDHRHFAHLQDFHILSVKLQPNDVVVVTEFEHLIGDDGDGPFLVPVLQTCSNSLTSMPFVISLTQEEAASKEIIEEKLAVRAKNINGVDYDPVEFGFIKDRFGGRGLYTGTTYSRPNPLSDRLPNDGDQEMELDDQEGEGEGEAETDVPSGDEGEQTDEIDQSDQAETQNDGLSSTDPDVPEFTAADDISSSHHEDLTQDDDTYSALASLTRTPESSSNDEDTTERAGAADDEQANGSGQLVYPREALAVSWDQKVSMAPVEPFKNEEADALIAKAQEEKVKGVHLDDCLDLFSKTEILGQDDVWYCNRCKDMRQASKTIRLWSVPEIFTIHLKRFSSSRSLSDKLSNEVDFPIEGLDMSKRVLGAGGEELIYDLFAVDNHYGGIGGGHYTAYAKNFVDNNWYYFDDDRVRLVNDPSEVVTNAAYLLFYRRRSTEPLGTEQVAKYVHEMRAKNYECEPEEAEKPQSMFGSNPFSNSQSGNSFRSDGRILGSNASRFGSSSSGGIWSSNQATLNLKSSRDDDYDVLDVDEGENENENDDQEQEQEHNNDDTNLINDSDIDNI